MEQREYEEGGDFFKGLFIACLLSVPLWLSIFGWVKFFWDDLFHLG